MLTRIAAVLTEAWLVAMGWTAAYVLADYLTSAEAQSHVSPSSMFVLGAAMVLKTGVATLLMPVSAGALVWIAGGRARYNKGWLDPFWGNFRARGYAWLRHIAIAILMLPVGMYAAEVLDRMMVRILI